MRNFYTNKWFQVSKKEEKLWLFPNKSLQFSPVSAWLIRKKQQEENMMEDKTSDLSSGSESPQENVERFENKNMIYISQKRF